MLSNQEIWAAAFALCFVAFMYLIVDQVWDWRREDKRYQWGDAPRKKEASPLFSHELLACFTALWVSALLAILLRG